MTSTTFRNRALSRRRARAPSAPNSTPLRARTVATLGQRDANYIRAIVALGALHRSSPGAALLYARRDRRRLSRPALLWPACIARHAAAGLSKILENMELGHNVMHGQYDWMRDPHLDGKTYEWDIAGTGDNWRKTHNYLHHTWTNVRGMDDDVGYGLLRCSRSSAGTVLPVPPGVAVVFALLFEWGVAIQDLQLGRWFDRQGHAPRSCASTFAPVGRKMARQVLKDYVFFPLLAGPFFLPVLLGNSWRTSCATCGRIRSSSAAISPPTPKPSPRTRCAGESRGHWYLRQLRGSSNLTGGKLMDLMTGNLSHQIEHHFFPDIPANRYAAMAVEVRDICARYGQHYNTGSLPRQFGQVIWRILRHAFPSRPPAKKSRRLARAQA